MKLPKMQCPPTHTLHTYMPKSVVLTYKHIILSASLLQVTYPPHILPLLVLCQSDNVTANIFEFNKKYTHNMIVWA